MQPDDVHELVNAGDPRISPDGGRVAYTVTEIDKDATECRSAIWVAPLDGASEPSRFTPGARRDPTPRSPPDGKGLPFAANRGGDDKAPANRYVSPARRGE